MVKSLNVSESSSESWPRRLGFALRNVNGWTMLEDRAISRTHNHPVHTEVADQQLGSPDRSTGRYSTRLGSLGRADGSRSSHRLVGVDCWHQHCSSLNRRSSRRLHAQLHTRVHAAGVRSPDHGRPAGIPVLDRNSLGCVHPGSMSPWLEVDGRTHRHNGLGDGPTLCRSNKAIYRLRVISE